MTATRPTSRFVAIAALVALAPTAFGQLSGTIDLAEVGDAVAGVTFRGIDPDDNSGYSVSSAGDVNGDGLADLLVGARGASPNGDFEAGETYLVFGSDSLPGSFDLAGADVIFSGFDPGDHSGASVSSAGDVNGDGRDDLLIGAVTADPSGDFNARESYLVYGSDTLPANFDLAGADVTFSRIDFGYQSGYSVSSAGDVNGDGLADLLIGAWGAEPFGDTYTSETHLIYGRASLPSNFDLTGADVNFNVSGGFQSVSSTGDVNGDGRDDLLIGGAPLAGETYLVFGGDSLPGSFDLASADVTFSGIDDFDFSSSSISSAGDVNGDGLADLLIGAFGADVNGDSGAGETYLIFGSTTLPRNFDLASADVIFSGTGDGAFSGYSVSSAGDVNGDGLADLLIGAWGVGETYLVYGSATLLRNFDLKNADVIFSGIYPDDRSGYSVSSAGDVNGDGLADLLIGAFGASPNGNFEAGETYLVFGQPIPEPSVLVLAGLASVGVAVQWRLRCA